ncbi:MAG TPA: signal recognition particle-docking protein FtsY [Euryarchaeota archaeon]|nr:signal recognition particle-docking protein FtsY [Euryarchaeota archaeon]
MFRALRDFIRGAADKAAQEEPIDFSESVGDRGKRIKEGALDRILDELEMELMSADVALPVAEEMVKGVRERLAGKRFERGLRLDEVIESAIKRSIKDILSRHRFAFWSFLEKAERPAVIMFVGVNGTGKTSVIAKLAWLLSEKGYSSVFAAGDTFRAGAIEQISIHADRLGTRVIKHQAGSDPAAVAYDAIEHARARRKDVVLIDTAGRMQTNRNLMDEMKKIKRVASPDLIVFVGDSLTGSDSIVQAKEFDAAVGIGAAILTKIDADAKGGAAISISSEIGKPIIFLTHGQEYQDIREFDPDWLISQIFSED